MKNVRVMLLMILSLASFSFKAQAQAHVSVTAGCPANLNLTYEEKSAYVGFNARLSHLRRHYGQPTYNQKFNEILSEAWPNEKVIDVSPAFMERTLNLVEQKHLENLIHQTVGLDNPKWVAFNRHLRAITMFDGGYQNMTHDRATKELIDEIQALKRIDHPAVPQYKRRFVGFTDNELGLLKARTATSVLTMYAYMGRWAIINSEIIRQEAEAARQRFITLGIVAVAGGVSIVATAYMGSIMLTAATISAGFATDLVVAANLAKITRLVVGAGVVGGGVGAPAFDIANHVWKEHADATAASFNNDTLYACEIQKRMDAWRARGVSPYLKTSLRGATIGLAGAGLAMHRVTARVLLTVLVGSVATAQVATVNSLVDNKMMQAEEVRLAILAHERGDKEKALEHLRQSRLHEADFKSDGMKTILIGALSLSIAGSLKGAFANDDAIGVIYANSADTIPEVLKIVTKIYTETRSN